MVGFGVAPKAALSLLNPPGQISPESRAAARTPPPSQSSVGVGIGARPPRAARSLCIVIRISSTPSFSNTTQLLPQYPFSGPNSQAVPPPCFNSGPHGCYQPFPPFLPALRRLRSPVSPPSDVGDHTARPPSCLALTLRSCPSPRRLLPRTCCHQRSLFSAALSLVPPLSLPPLHHPKLPETSDITPRRLTLSPTRPYALN